MIEISIKCLHCGKSLMDDEVEIDNKPSVRVTIEFEGKRGRLNLSSLYGSFDIDAEYEIPTNEVIQFFCPYCDHELQSSRTCRKCEAPMVTLKFVHGGIIRICSRRGCKKHLFEFESLEDEVREFYETYSTFFKGDRK